MWYLFIFISWEIFIVQNVFIWLKKKKMLDSMEVHFITTYILRFFLSIKIKLMCYLKITWFCSELFCFYFQTIVRRCSSRKFWLSHTNHAANSYTVTNVDGSLGDDQQDNGLPSQQVCIFLFSFASSISTKIYFTIKLLHVSVSLLFLIKDILMLLKKSVNGLF